MGMIRVKMDLTKKIVNFLNVHLGTPNVPITSVLRAAHFVMVAQVEGAPMLLMKTIVRTGYAPQGNGNVKITNVSERQKFVIIWKIAQMAPMSMIVRSTSACLGTGNVQITNALSLMQFVMTCHSCPQVALMNQMSTTVKVSLALKEKWSAQITNVLRDTNCVMGENIVLMGQMNWIVRTTAAQKVIGDVKTTNAYPQQTSVMREKIAMMDQMSSTVTTRHVKPSNGSALTTNVWAFFMFAMGMTIVLTRQTRSIANNSIAPRISGSVRITSASQCQRFVMENQSAETAVMDQMNKIVKTLHVSRAIGNVEIISA